MRKKKAQKSFFKKLSVKKINWKKIYFKKEPKKDQSQLVLTFETCESDHEPWTDYIEGKLKKKHWSKIFNKIMSSNETKNIIKKSKKKIFESNYVNPSTPQP